MLSVPDLILLERAEASGTGDVPISSQGTGQSSRRHMKQLSLLVIRQWVMHW